MDTRRLLLFLIGCIGTRAALTYTAAVAGPTLLTYMAVGTAAISIGFMAIYLFGLRPTGPEVFGERIWWNDLRPIHAAFYGLFAVCAFMGVSRAWMLLAADTTLGLGAFLYHHFG